MRVFAGLLILALSPIAVCSAAEVKPDPCQGITSGPDLTKESNPTTRNPVLWDPKRGDRSLTVSTCLVVTIDKFIQPTSPGNISVSLHGLYLNWNVGLVNPSGRMIAWSGGGPFKTQPFRSRSGPFTMELPLESLKQYGTESLWSADRAYIEIQVSNCDDDACSPTGKGPVMTFTQLIRLKKNTPPDAKANARVAEKAGGRGCFEPLMGKNAELRQLTVIPILNNSADKSYAVSGCVVTNDASLSSAEFHINQLFDSDGNALIDPDGNPRYYVARLMPRKSIGLLTPPKIVVYLSVGVKNRKWPKFPVVTKADVSWDYNPCSKDNDTGCSGVVNKSFVGAPAYLDPTHP